MPDSLTCVVVTPEQTALEQKADFVALPLYDGEIGIGANHSPLIGRLGYGEMRIKSVTPARPDSYEFAFRRSTNVDASTRPSSPSERIAAGSATANHTGWARSSGRSKISRPQRSVDAIE